MHRELLEPEVWSQEPSLNAAQVDGHGSTSALACFSPVPRTHEPERLLELTLVATQFPSALRATAEGLVHRLSDFGLQEHILLALGPAAHRVLRAGSFR
jgi:hypothetical protein